MNKDLSRFVMYYETCHICVTYCCTHEAQIIDTLRFFVVSHGLFPVAPPEEARATDIHG